MPNPPKILAAFWGICPAVQGEKQLQLLKKFGLNMALVNDSGYDVKAETWREWGKIADKYKINVCPIHSFAGTKEIEILKGKYKPYVDRSGKTLASTPCPLDATYWSISIAERLEQLAYLSKSTTLFAALFDTEMYGAELSIYRDPCFCDVCWQEFVQSGALKDQTAYTLKKEERFPYLTRRNLLERYADVQEYRLQGIVSRIEQHIHSINPDLQLGFLAYNNNWFYRGLIRGLGTAANPALVFSETSYVRGYTPYVDQERVFIEEDTRSPGHTERTAPPIACYIPGIWLGRFYPDELSSQLYHIAAHSNGYWLFTASSLWMEGEKPGAYALHGSNAEHWEVFKQANNELDRFSQAPGTYQSNLPPIYPSSFYNPLQERLMTPSSLANFLLDMASQNAFPQDAQKPQVTYRGTTLFHGLKQTPAASIQITHVSLGYSEPTRYKLFDSRGELLQEGRLDLESPSVTIALPQDLFGVVSVLTESGINATQITFSELPYLVEASATFPLYIANTISTYTIYVKPDQQHVRLYAYCCATQTAALTVQSPDNRVNQTTEIRKHTEIRVPVPVAGHTPVLYERQTQPNSQLSRQLDSGRAIPLNVEQPGTNQRFWTIGITPVPTEPYETVQFYLYNAELPYILMWR
jgi:hypothetical protein